MAHLRRRAIGRSIAAVATLLLVSTGCSDITKDDAWVYVPPSPKPNPDPRIFQPSDVDGGTLHLARTGDWPSLDPADITAPYARNFARNFVRTLLVFRATPRTLWNPNKADALLDLIVPDLAQGLGEAADGGRTWTYRLRPGVRYETGAAVVAGDVKRGVERALARPAVAAEFPFVRDLITAVETPDDLTVVFRLSRPTRTFDYIAQLPMTAPVPADHQPAEGRGGAVPSSGPYRVKSHVAGKRIVFARNEHYRAGTDPRSGRKPLPNSIELELNVPPAELASRLGDGTIDMEIAGSGNTESAVAGEVVGVPTPSGFSETVPIASLAYILLNPAIDPLWNVNCRRAAVLAADKAGYHRAYGDPATVRPATSILPPTISATPSQDLLGLLELPSGDVANAIKSLETCQAQNGFTTAIAYRAESAEDAAAAEALKVSMARSKIILTLLPLPSEGFYTETAGNAAYAKEHGIGFVVAHRRLPWPEGHDFMTPILDTKTPGIAAVADVRAIAEATPWLDREGTSLDMAVRDTAWRQLDRLATKDALVLPGVWGQNTLHRPTRPTNVFVNEAFANYDYTTLGIRKN